MAKILGLDLGTNSIGWAVVEKERDCEFQLTDKGVRIFQEGVKIEKGIEGSKAAERTGFRSARRLKYRRKLRKIELLKVLSAYGYCPTLTNEELLNWRYKKVYPRNQAFLNWQSTDEASSKNPYHYRALAVEQKFDLEKEEDRFKIGRAFYHIAQRRGFLSNRLEGTKESDGAVKKSISEINSLKGDKTLGQYFYEKYRKREKIRNTYTHREEHYLDEFKRICEFQKLDSEFTAKARKAIFYQRPLKSQKGLVGKCVFEPNKPRCSVSRPEFEEYRMLCFVNNMKIKTPTDEHLRFLTEEEKKKIMPQFFRKSKDYFDFEDLAKQLAPKHQYKFYKRRDKYPEDWLFNYSMKTIVSGCPVSTRLKDLFGEDIMAFNIPYIREKDGKKSVIDIDDIWHVLFSYDSEDKLKEFAEKRLQLTEDQVKDFLKIRLRKEYASLSLKAIKKIVPFLKEGLIYSHAVFLANMEDAIPKEIWEIEENRNIIRTEIANIIANQKEEKQICEIVNGIIKINHTDEAVWSEAASEIFKKDLLRKIKAHFGEKTYNAFSEEKKNRVEISAFELLKKQMQKNSGRGEFVPVHRIDDKVKAFISDNFDVEPKSLAKIYHPSAIEVYKPPVRKDDGKLYLGSPMVSSIRNPMAMRALHQLRKVINELIKTDVIDSGTHIHIEMARGLMNSNERKAWQSWQRDRENLRKEYALKIKEHLSSDAEPSETDILKYQLWEEQNHKCIYTGKEIALSEFLGANPSFDIEHTIPRSISFDNSQVNKTLCENTFNRSVKKNKIPYELSNHLEILARIECWKEKYEELDKQIAASVRQARVAIDKESKDRAIQKRHKLKLDFGYWKNKYERFTMEDVPEGFKNSQLVDTGIITKYSRLYLNTLFDKVYTVKGSTVADFRKLWGLQDEYEKKARVNHIHHCIDAITIACITKENYDNLAKFYHDFEDLKIKGVEQLPRVKKPWKTFAEDVKAIEDEVLISHYTPDVLPKQTRKKLRDRGRIKKDKNGNPIYQNGDTVRGSLHQQTFYGAIEKAVINKKGESEKVIKYVVRKSLDSLEDSSIKNVVDERVREIIQHARLEEKKLKKEIEVQKKKLEKAEEEEENSICTEIERLNSQISELYTLPNKNGAPIPIKKVRIYQTSVTNPLHIKEQRDKSKKKLKSHKEFFHVANDSNYAMAIYEGKDAKGKIKRDFQLLNNMQAGEFFKFSVQKDLKAQNLNQIHNLVPDKIVQGKAELSFKAVLKIGTMVVLWENSPEEVWDLTVAEINKRLYKIVGLSQQIIQGKYFFGTIVMRHHKEASSASDLKTSDGKFEKNESYKAQRKMNHNQFNALVEGVDFKIDPLGNIKRIN
ncbi:CRISPR-associated endonuclease Csn1 [Mariniphaga anaerophila]|uniref:CRISPR-associated endonuclease Cas9 n=1 Tax=Mariniphaga anaerophila TaxID=1484053 RepID=A0A1M4WUM9_9BACT|nr:type II CRISPR RNA-guided endonuclease Cas9 [Mariniphaga anaerophila]SHE84934.1 CRISPR-associated endonuclease Csn1 [Mariniphaga anaerophila]